VYDNPSPFLFHLAHAYGDAPTVSKVHAIYKLDSFACKQSWIVKVGTILGEQTYRALRGEDFITNSESTAERLRTLVPTDRNRVRSNPIGIRSGEFEFNHDRASNQVLSLSKLTPRKGIDDLLRAWKQVEEVHPDASLVIAGSGPQESELKSLADSLGVESVEFAGYVSEERKQTLLTESRVFVLPTLLEGFGLANLEAMAAGCTVVSSNTWGVKDYLEDGANGVAVDPRSPDELAGALSRLLRDRDYAETLAHRGRETAARFSMTESLRRELDLLEDIVDE
jgi:glycosyltransferase involved in cell wall biosynthesis